MKRKSVILLLLLIIFSMSGCFTSITNPLIDEDTIVFEDSNKTFRLEIAVEYSWVGRLNISKEDDNQSYVIEYSFAQKKIKVYTDAPNPEVEDNYILLKVSYKSINFFKTDYDIMYLKYDGICEQNDSFSDLNLELRRLDNEEINILNYFYNGWESSEDNMAFINDDLTMFYGYCIKGNVDGLDVWISFSNDVFSVWTEDLSTILSGEYSFNDKNIVLEQFGWYTDFPDIITLTFVELENA